MIRSNEEINTYGCPLHDQTGAQAIKNFDLIVARLSPDQRAWFEAERAHLEADQREYGAACGYTV